MTEPPNTEARERVKAASERLRQLGRSYPDVPPNTEALREDIVRGLLKDRTPDEAAIAATALHDFVARFDAIASELEVRREMPLIEGQVPSQWYWDMKRRAEAAEAERDELRRQLEELRNG